MARWTTVQITKLCSLLKNMYSRLTSCVKIGDKITEFFLSEVRTSQGCNLSPMIFNSFINELPKLLLHANTDPILLEGKEVPILMNADDVVILSKSAMGLNRALNVSKLSMCFVRNGNYESIHQRLKVLIFNARKWDKFKFFLGNNLIAIKDTYTYLGFIVTPSGRFIACIKNLIMKAKKSLQLFQI